MPDLRWWACRALALTGGAEAEDLQPMTGNAELRAVGEFRE
jgi:hypothetical protein